MTKRVSGRDWSPIHVNEFGPVVRRIVDHVLVDRRDGERVEIVGVRCPWYLWVTSELSTLGGIAVAGFVSVGRKELPIWKLVRSPEVPVVG